VNFQIGDIGINTSGVGHVMMIYEGGDDSTAKIIHANRRRNFHIESNRQESDNGAHISYLADGYDKLYRPPWAGGEKAAKQRFLQQVAAVIARRATYGIGRAIRLWMGSSTFGDGARDRLAKYKERLLDLNNLIGDGKVVSTVTCSEAVILCYQLTFDVGEPQFIELDAAHTMPNTLATWLGRNWGELVRNVRADDAMNQQRSRAPALAR
jgi:hypothetical protein